MRPYVDVLKKAERHDVPFACQRLPFGVDPKNEFFVSAAVQAAHGRAPSRHLVSATPSVDPLTIILCFHSLEYLGDAVETHLDAFLCLQQCDGNHRSLQALPRLFR